MSGATAGDTLQWSLQDPNPSFWDAHRLYCRSTSATKDVWVMGTLSGGNWVDGAPSYDGLAYYHATQTWQDEDTAAADEPHTPTGYISLGGTVTQSTNPEFVRIQIVSGQSQYVWITSPYYTATSSGSGTGNPPQTPSTSSNKKVYHNFW